jgi:excisionase family DNA binding protein
METIIVTTQNQLQAIVKQAVNEALELQNLPKEPKRPNNIGVKEAAELLKITVATVYQLTHRREIPFYKLPGGKKLIFKRDELLNYLQSGRSSTIREIEEAISCNSIKVA